MNINVDEMTPQQRQDLLTQLQEWCPDCKNRKKRASEPTCFPCAIASESGVEVSVVERVVTAARRLQKVSQASEQQGNQHQTVGSITDDAGSSAPLTPLKVGKWHVDAYGEVTPCRSLSPSCPAKFGHFATKDDAWRWWKRHEQQGGKPTKFFRWHITRDKQVRRCGNSWTCTDTRKELHFKTEHDARSALRDDLPTLFPFMDLKV